jgi:RNA polymerase sigma factor (sigma-70 family)
MDDSEILAALQGGDPAGLAAAYDRYAAPLYGYCRWVLRDPAQAAKALRETFAVAAREGGGPKDAGQLRAWLYAIARDQCYRRLRTAEPGFDEITDRAGREGQAAGAGRTTELTEVQRLIRETLAELKPQEHEVIELSVRHSLDEAELATVLEVSWSRAHTLATHAREHLETALDALLIARTGRESCPDLAALLSDWDGRLTVPVGQLTARHLEHCETCASRRHGALRPEMVSRLLPLAELPAGLREPVLQRAAASAAATSRGPLARLTAALRSVGLRRTLGLLSWSKIRANPGGATAAAAVALWIVAAMSVTLVTVSGLHGVRALAAPNRIAPGEPVLPAASNAAPTSPHASRSPLPDTRRKPSLLPTFQPLPPASPTASAKPKASKSASPSASSSSSASDSSSPSPTPTRTRTATPTPTPTPTPTDTPTPTPTDTPTT